MDIERDDGWTCDGCGTWHGADSLDDCDPETDGHLYDEYLPAFRGVVEGVMIELCDACGGPNQDANLHTAERIAGQRSDEPTTGDEAAANQATNIKECNRQNGWCPGSFRSALAE